MAPGLTPAGTPPVDPARFRLLASALARRPLGIATASPGEEPHTDGARVYVSDGGAREGQLREIVAQAALLGAGSLAPDMVRALRGRPRVARRYLSLEGTRVLARLAGEAPGIARLLPHPPVAVTASPAESLMRAQGRDPVPAPPGWFGQIRPGKLLDQPAAGSSAPTAADLRQELAAAGRPEAEDGEEAGDTSKVLRLFQNPLNRSNFLANFLSGLLGLSRQSSSGPAGGEMPTGSIRSVSKVGPHARPLPAPLPLPDDETPAGVAGSGGALYPEWDETKRRYRPEWCRVVEVPLGPSPGADQAAVERDEVLRRRLARLGLGPKVVRRQADGDDLDVDGLIELAVEVRSGQSPRGNIYTQRRRLARDLGVLILLDASGSASETDPQGNSVHQLQRRAAATLVATLEQLGDRVALYGFRSLGRGYVEILPLKPFRRRFGTGERGRLNTLEPTGYTRLGAAIRHAAEILKTDAGTRNRMLLVLSDGFPYDHGYEGSYSESDVSRALAEVRHDGIACLCLSVGASTPPDALGRVFGAAAHAGAARLADLSGRMDELFLSALRELSRARSRATPAPPAGDFRL